VQQHAGVIVKMTGDGMYAAFEQPVGALHAAMSLERALADPQATGGMSLKVRYGVHLGIVERRDDDLFGTPANRAARIMKAAHGSQVLVSQAVVDALGDELPPDTSLRDLGAVRLRDLASSEHLYQLVHPHLRRDFPALRSLAATPNNLPQQVTSFIGRERELAEIKDQLSQARLLTLLGMGGLGKTRLSLQVGADLLENYDDGVWFVDLAPIADAALVPAAVAEALGLREEAGQVLTQTLCKHVRDRQMLVILDNCEHLLAGCAALADALLRAGPQLRMVATSREPLRIGGEQTYPVLPLKPPDHTAGLDALLRSEAVQLFVERARLQKPGFTLTERDAPAVAALCVRLDGIPLALELAAARMRSLSIHEINARLHDRFKLLTGGSRIALGRQQTLHALVSWSYDLLQEREQMLLDRVSVFAGGFDLEAAEAVCGADPLDPYDVVDLLGSLVEKSLVMVEQGETTSRYGLLETIREFARERSARRYDMANTVREMAQDHLVDRDDLAATGRRHCDYYFALVKQSRDKTDGVEQGFWMARLERDLDNIRAAIALALAGKTDPLIAVKFEVALMRFRILRGYATEGRDNIRAALLLAPLREPSVGRAHALYVGGALAMTLGDHVDAARQLSECLAVRRSLGHERDIAATLSTLASLHLSEDRPDEAQECQAEAIAIFRELGDAVGEAIGVQNLGEIAVRQGNADAARGLFEEGLRLARLIPHQELESECERNLGDLALADDDLAEARERFTRSLELCRSSEDRRGEVLSQWRLGRTEALAGNAPAAMERIVVALRSMLAFAMQAEALDALEDYGRLLTVAGRAADAARVFGACEASRSALSLPRARRVADEWSRGIEAARAALKPALFDRSWNDGGALRLHDAVQQVLAPDRAPAALAA
jgi:predicted ATPase